MSLTHCPPLSVSVSFLESSFLFIQTNNPFPSTWNIHAGNKCLSLLFWRACTSPWVCFRKSSLNHKNSANQTLVLRILFGVKYWKKKNTAVFCLESSVFPTAAATFARRKNWLKFPVNVESQLFNIVWLSAVVHFKLRSLTRLISFWIGGTQSVEQHPNLVSAAS